MVDIIPVRQWTPAFTAKIKALWLAGKTGPEIEAIIPGITWRQISKVMVRIGCARENPWSPADLEKLRQLCAEGLTSTQIAAAMPGKSRHSICGKIFRAGIPWIHIKTRRAMEPKPPKEKKAKIIQFKPKPKKPVEPEPIGPIADFVDNGCCKFMHGDPLTATWRMCGGPSLPEKSWCEFHAKKVFVKKSEKKPEDRRGFTLHRVARAA